MARQRQWKDRRAWVEKDARNLVERDFPRYAWWKALLGIVMHKQAKRWRKEYARKKDAAFRYVIKKMSHGTFKNDPKEFERARHQVARARKRHAAWIEANPILVAERKAKKAKAA